ncbi:hypothetical protein [Streptomyces sp. MK5]|uniref:hypothetical protein n=1 Tax=Streptomyces sp. MK5 TaxID=3064253 RepID=UPI0027414F06|nr:hypothetical protein [Streptomyces sp. MK5]
MRTTDDQRRQAEDRIRAAMDRLLRGEVPPGGRCDLKTLATQAGVNRTGFYPKEGRPGPFRHLAEEFSRRRDLLQEAGTVPDPREAQIVRLKEEVSNLRQRQAERDTKVEELTDFRQRAISQLAAQHLEIERLRQRLAGEPQQQVTHLPGPRHTTTIGPC